MNKEANVSPSMRLKVQNVINELDYLPSASARGLATKQSYNIGLAYSNVTPSYIHALQTGALAACREQGYDLLIYPCEVDNPNLCNDLALLFSQQKVDGLILTPPLTDHHPLIARLTKEHALFANISPIHHHPGIPDVQTNEQAAACSLTEHLIGLGHRNIGIILGPPDHAASINRLAGFTQALKSAGITFDKKYLAQGEFDFESGQSCTRALLKLEPKPTAIFACNDAIAAGVMSVAYQQGMTLPQDLSITGFDNSPTASLTHPTLTTVKQPTQELAYIAAQMLINTLRKESINESAEAPGCELIIRESTAAKP